MISFLDFARFAAPTKPLTAAQTEFCRVAFDGERPSDDDIARALWGDVIETFTDEQRRIVGAVWGRRSGKTWLAGIRLVHLAIVVDLSTLARNEQAVCPIVATTMNQARHTLNFIRGVLDNVAPQAVVRDTSDIITIRREGKREVTFQVLPASAGGRSLRGKWFPGAFLDESCFFYGTDHKVNDQEIFASIMPTVLPGGQVLIMSTPFAEAGLLYDLYKENYGHPKWALAAYAPTLMMRPDDANLAALIEQERQRDPINAQREYDGEFLPSTANRFFDSRAIDLAMLDGDEPRHIARNTGLPCAFGGDFAFISDASALVGVQRNGEIYEVFLLHERLPSKGKPLVPSEVVAEFAQLITANGGHALMADAHYRESVREHLNATKLPLIPRPEGADGKAQTYLLTRQLLNQGRIRLPHNDRLARQLRDVTASPTSGGLLNIQTARYATGGHGDLVSSLVLAIWSCVRNAGGTVPSGGLTGSPRPNLGPMGSSTGRRARW